MAAAASFSSSSCLAFVLLSLLASPCFCQTCSKSHTFNGQNKLFANCNDLSVQDATIAWSLQAHNNTLEVLFSGTAPSAGGWVGWGINPSALSMEGTQAFIAFQASNGSTILTYNVTAGTKAMSSPLKCTPISLHVLDKAVQISGTRISMLVSLRLNPQQSTLLNHVWNRGSSVSNFQPGIHGTTPADLSTLKTINMSSGMVTTATVEPAHYLLKNRHAVLNTVGWGILLPLGVIVARYLRPFTDPAWFYAHVLIQMAGYSLGVAGWATGLRLGSYSVGIVYRKHRSIGIALFAIATLQVAAILLRPKKDHKIRKGWNLYHYSLGATILVLGILNIFYGFDMLSPPSKWRHAYIGVLGGLAGITVVFEISSWVYVFSKKHSSQDKLRGATIGGPHGVGSGPHGQVV